MERKFRLTDELVNKLYQLDRKFDYYRYESPADITEENAEKTVHAMYCMLYEDPERYADEIKALDKALTEAGYEGIEDHEFLYKLVNIESDYDYYNFRDSFDYTFDAMTDAGADIPWSIKIMREEYENDPDGGPEALEALDNLLEEYGYQEN